MNTDTLASESDTLDNANAAMFRLQNALRAPIATIGETFPLADGKNRSNFEKEIQQFEGMTLNEVLHQAVTTDGPARDFCGRAAIKYWVFDEVNPLSILFPLYKQMFGVR